MSNNLRLHQLNDVRLTGRLTRDPELRFTPKGLAVCTLSLALNHRYKDAASGQWKDATPTYVNVIVWREAAQRCGDQLKKGSPVYVEGRLRSRAWEGKDGQKRSTLEVETIRIQFLEKTEQSADPSAGSNSDGHGSSAAADEGVVENASAGTEEEVPF
ncbi:MAG TPA: single-stranded DNA-binding protein [Elusimicrobiota bacterium]|nr:single-stranded DNA-binding protein [Elusimicrobiota bacterium]